jgi:hypothetical protein
MKKKRRPTVWHDMLAKRDAVSLLKWWNANSKAPYQEFEIRRSPSNAKFWALYRL